MNKTWQGIGLNALGGVLSYPFAYSLVFLAGYFIDLPNGVATAIFVTTYSGLVLVFVIRIWDDVRTLTNDVKILIILDGKETLTSVPALQQSYQKLFDEETYEFFQRLLSAFPQEYTVFKFNRLFFMKGIACLPTQKLKELVNDQKAFSQLLAVLKTEDFIRTDGFSFSIQLTKWEDKKKEIQKIAGEYHGWQEIANCLIECNRN